MHTSPTCGVAGANGPFSREFHYDALYRLVQATGRESGQYSNYSSPYTEPHVPDNSASNTRAYTRNYEYDRIGNILKLNHVATGNTFNRWFNDFQNNAAAFQLSNLATEITYGSTTINYGFDANGNQISEGSSRSFEWDYGDRMRGFSEGTTNAAYLYDSGGNRVKKVVKKSSSLKEVTVYIDGGFEYLYTLDGTNTVGDESNEIHVMDDRSRIAKVTVEYGITDVIKYNLEDHLGNSSFTLDDVGSLISREEYFPFGETSFGSYAKKRYRFCEKERDEESGLYYYGARYYAAWSCRFVSVDPLAGEYPFYTPYQYAGNKPINFIDLDGLEEANGGASGIPTTKAGGEYDVTLDASNGRKTGKVKLVHSPNETGGETIVNFTIIDTNGVEKSGTAQDFGKKGKNLFLKNIIDKYEWNSEGTKWVSPSGQDVTFIDIFEKPKPKPEGKPEGKPKGKPEGKPTPEVNFRTSVLFNLFSDTPKYPESFQRDLENGVDFLQKNTDYDVLILGNASSKAYSPSSIDWENPNNWEKEQDRLVEDMQWQRAELIKQELVSLGISEERIHTGPGLFLPSGDFQSATVISNKDLNGQDSPKWNFSHTFLELFDFQSDHTLNLKN